MVVAPAAGSRQFVEQLLRFRQILRSGTFSEPAIDRGKLVAGFARTSLVSRISRA
jgi:hypothetical protein